LAQITLPYSAAAASMLAFLHAWIFWEIWILCASLQNRGMWRHGSGTNQWGQTIMEVFWSKPQLIVVIRNHKRSGLSICTAFMRINFFTS